MPTSWHVQRVRLGLNQFAALRLLLWLERYNSYSLNFWTKLMGKSCSYWPDLWLSLQRIPMLGDLTHTHEREFRRDCKIVRMHVCGLYFSTRKPVDYQQRVGPLRTRRKGYRHLAGEGRPDFSAFLEEQTSKVVATSLCGSFNQTGRLRTSYHKRHWKLS